MKTNKKGAPRSGAPRCTRSTCEVDDTALIAALRAGLAADIEHQHQARVRMDDVLFKAWNALENLRVEIQYVRPWIEGGRR